MPSARAPEPTTTLAWAWRSSSSCPIWGGGPEGAGVCAVALDATQNRAAPSDTDRTLTGRDRSVPPAFTRPASPHAQHIIPPDASPLRPRPERRPRRRLHPPDSGTYGSGAAPQRLHAGRLRAHEPHRQPWPNGPARLLSEQPAWLLRPGPARSGHARALPRAGAGPPRRRGRPHALRGGATLQRAAVPLGPHRVPPRGHHARGRDRRLVHGGHGGEGGGRLPARPASAAQHRRRGRTMGGPHLRPPR